MYFNDIAARDGKEVAPGVVIRTFWTEKMLMSHVSLAPNAIVPLHSHPHEQCGVWVQGTATFIIGNETYEMKPGDSYMIPGDVEHKVINHDAPAIAMDIFSPVRESYQYE